MTVSEPIANADQAAAWNGPEGEGWASDWEIFDRSIAFHQERLAEASAVTDGERVLDVGCGNGQSTRQAAAATPSGSALGIDLSGPMLERARSLAAAEGRTNVEFVQGDAQVHPFEAGAYDLAISRFGSMFFEDKVAAFTNVGAALRPGGRLLLVVWQAVSENEQFQSMLGSMAAGRELPTPPPGGPHPFSLADPEVGRRLLTDAGFIDIAHQPARGPFSLGVDAESAYAFAARSPMVQNLGRDLDDATRAKALDTLRRSIEDHETDDGVLFQSAAWLISARRP